MDEDRFDVALVGVDPTRPRDEVVRGLARRLVKSAAEIEELLARAPSPVLRSVVASAVPGLLEELRDLGARVKRQEARPLLEAEPADAPAVTIEPSRAAHVEEPAEPEPEPSTPETEDARPLASGPAPIDSDAAAPAPTGDPSPGGVPPSPPAPLALRPDAPWLAPKSLPEGTFSREPAPKVAPRPLAKPVPSAARRGRAETRVTPDPPAQFYEALPRALRAPFARATAWPLALAPLLGALALALITMGLRRGEQLGPLGVALGTTAAAGFLEAPAPARGERAVFDRERTARAAASPRLVPDYLGPGARLLVGAGVLVWLGFAARDALASHGVTPLVGWLLLALAASYATLAFALVVANGTTLALLDATHAWTLVRHGGLRTLVLLVLGGPPLVLGTMGAIRVVDMASHARTLRVVVADLAILGPAAAAATTLGAVVTGSLVALLVRARE